MSIRIIVNYMSLQWSKFPTRITSILFLKYQISHSCEENDISLFFIRSGGGGIDPAFRGARTHTCPT